MRIYTLVSKSTVKRESRFFHYYPLRVVKGKNDRYYYVDRNGTMMPVPSDTDTFNTVYFDTVQKERLQHGKN